MAPMGNHAVIFGASGVGGWSIVDQLLCSYPSVCTFSRVTAMVNRPLKLEDSGWPIATSSSPSMPELKLISGVNLAEGTYDEFTETVRTALPDASSVTHVFIWSFKPDWTDEKREARINHEMLRRATIAFERLAGDNLRMVLFPGGGKAYGIHSGGGIYESPFREDAPRSRLSKDQQEGIHYFASEQFLRDQSAGKAWSWCELHFDAVIGFSPHGSAFNLTAFWATYLSLYAAVEGKGAKVPFPGTKEAYRSCNNEAGADMIARMAIWCALNPDKAGGQVFNIADNAMPMNNIERWPRLAAYFGLEGVAPNDEWDATTAPKPGDYVEKHKDVLVKKGVKPNEVFGSKWLDGYGVHFNFDRAMDISKARKAGFTEERDPIVAWHKAWDRFTEAGLVIRQ